MNKETLYTNANRVITEFMEAWLYQDYDQMYQLTNLAWTSRHTNDFLWEMYSGILIDDYKIHQLPPAPERPMVQAEIKIMYNGMWLKPANVNLVCEVAPYKTSLHGRWGVNPDSTLKLIQRPKTRAERRKQERAKTKRRK